MADKPKERLTLNVRIYDYLKQRGRKTGGFASALLHHRG